MLSLHSTLVDVFPPVGVWIGSWLKTCKISTFGFVAAISLDSFFIQKEHFLCVPLFTLNCTKIPKTVVQARGFLGVRTAAWFFLPGCVFRAWEDGGTWNMFGITIFTSVIISVMGKQIVGWTWSRQDSPESMNFFNFSCCNCIALTKPFWPSLRLGTFFWLKISGYIYTISTISAGNQQLQISNNIFLSPDQNLSKKFQVTDTMSAIPAESQRLYTIWPILLRHFGISTTKILASEISKSCWIGHENVETYSLILTLNHNSDINDYNDSTILKIVVFLALIPRSKKAGILRQG